MKPSTSAKRLLFATSLAGAMLGAAPLLAEQTADRLAPAFGNTIVSTHPDGRKARLWLERDGRYAAQGRAGKRSGGTWKLKGDKLCLHQSRPFPFPVSYCRTFPSETVGKPWADKAFNGQAVTNEIVPGGAPAT